MTRGHNTAATWNDHRNGQPRVYRTTMKATCTSTFLLSFLLAAPHVAAHGYLSKFAVNGKAYQGNSPGGPTNPSAIRQISAIDPVKGASNPDLNCGINAKPASQLAHVNPGDIISFTWSGGGGQNWPHNTGPLLTYMASCGSQTCDQFDAQTAKWFKIDQVSRGNDGNWVQEQIMKGHSVDVKIPANIAPGNYLVRHDIIALHLGVTLGGAEFYPACSQFVIGGNGSGRPREDETVSFPGGYDDHDPGIFDPNVYDTNAPYQFPGPPIARFVTSSSSSGASSSSSSAGGSRTPTATATATASAPTHSGSYCQLRRSSNSSHVPRHVSRIMRDLINSGWH